MTVHDGKMATNERGREEEGRRKVRERKKDKERERLSLFSI